MVFSSLVFLYVFLPLCLLCYYALPGLSWRNGVLILFSLVFYAWGEPVWVILMIVTSAVDWANALLIQRHRGRPAARWGVALSVVFNLGILVVFKYSAFLTQTLNSLTGLSLPVHPYHLPIGISFYAFQSLSYVLDVYRGDVAAQRSFPRYLLFVSLFHQLVAGPIVRYTDIEREIGARSFSWEELGRGIGRFAVGLAKKVILANSAGEVAQAFLRGDPAGMSLAGSWWGVLFFGLQIYFDFSGYSDMAIGLGHMFGFTYKENFDYPYAAVSATDFWRRWHISLSTFFRDYLYIPLGGRRRRPVFSLLTVWLLTGLWHGASWNFVVWGLYYGVLILLERTLEALTHRKLPRPIGHAYLLLATLVGWTLFSFDDLPSSVAHLRRMFGFSGIPLTNLAWELSVAAQALFLPLCIVACLPLWPALRRAAYRVGAARPRLARAGLTRAVAQALPTLGSLGSLAASTVLLVGKTYNPFLYFRF
jgi:alginate O-acetyltransferase complex protein AlgI